MLRKFIARKIAEQISGQPVMVGEEPRTGFEKFLTTFGFMVLGLGVPLIPLAVRTLKDRKKYPKVSKGWNVTDDVPIVFVEGNGDREFQVNVDGDARIVHDGRMKFSNPKQQTPSFDELLRAYDLVPTELTREDYHVLEMARRWLNARDAARPEDLRELERELRLREIERVSDNVEVTKDGYPELRPQ